MQLPRIKSSWPLATSAASLRPLLLLLTVLFKLLLGFVALVQMSWWLSSKMAVPKSPTMATHRMAKFRQK
jgi:hypothetical protein